MLQRSHERVRNCFKGFTSDVTCAILRAWKDRRRQGETVQRPDTDTPASEAQSSPHNYTTRNRYIGCNKDD